MSNDKASEARKGLFDNIAGKGEPAVYRMTAGDNRLRLKLTPGQLAALQRAVILSGTAAAVCYFVALRFVTAPWHVYPLQVLNASAVA